MSVEKHLPPLELSDYGTGTKARWSKDNSDGKLLIFVHGFNGAAIDTWAGFPDQLCLQTETSGYDLVCFGYESVTQRANESASDLHSFLNDLLIHKTLQVVNGSIKSHDSTYQRKAGFVYNQLVLVGHSLGCCVIRQVVLDHIQAGNGSWPKQEAWPAQTKLIMYAPAHHGAGSLKLAFAVSLGIQIIVSGVTTWSPILKELTPNSPYLKGLLDSTQKFCDANPQLKAAKTFWAWRDWVVTNGYFASDVKPPERIKGVGHVSICKPTGYQKTVWELLKQL